MEDKDKEIDEFIAEGLKKDITQEDKVSDSVTQHLGEMGFLWDRVQQKMQDDGICFSCKKEIIFENDAKGNLIEANKVEKGVVAFVIVCEECYDKNNKRVKKNDKDDKTKS